MSSSTIDTTTSSLDVGSVAKLAFILGFSTADVEVGGSSHVTATSKLDMQATSTVKIVADMTADSGKADNNTDAAVATIGITTNTYARITGNAVVNTTGALLNVSAKSSSTGIAIGDGTSGGAGATVGAAVITGETVAAVNDHAQITDASGVSITADRLNDATAVAKSTTKGSTDGDSSQESKKQLSGNDAQTGGGNSVSFAGAVAVSTVVSHSSAYLDTAGSVQSSGSLAVISTSATNSQARADGSATVADHDSNAANNTNVGIAVGIGVGDLHNDAYIKGESNTITANGVSIKATMGSHDRTLDFASGGVDASTGKITLLGGAAIAGASGGATSVAGALVINVGISHTNAYIADGTTVTVTGSGTVEIKAENFIEVTSKGTGKQTNGGSTGVGPVFSLNIGETDTNALLGDATLAPASAASVSGAGAVTISAASKNAMDNEAEGGAKSDKTAVTPVVAISVASNTTNANADAATSALNAGSLNVTASHEGSNNVSATGNTESGKTGVGISFALAITTDSAIATTARDVVASGAVAFNAKTASGTKSKAKSSVAGGDSNDSDKNDPNGGVNKKAADNKQFASDRATAKGGKSAGNTDGSSAEASGEDGSSKKVEVAGAVGITVANTTARASIPDGLTITAGNGTGITNGTLTVKSENNTDAQAVADGSVTNPGTTFDPTVSNATNKGYVDFSADNINLGTDTGLHTGDQIYYRANGGTAIGGLENGKTYFVRDIGSGKFELYDTKDHANDTLHTAGRRDLLKDTTPPAPTGTTQSLDPVDAEAAGTGVGIAVAVNVARVTNEALVGNSDITADGLIVQALVPQVGSSDKVDSFSAEATAGVSGIDTGIAGALAVNVGMSHSKAAIANSATVTITDGGDVALTAENFVANSTKASGKQEAGGKTGVGAAIGVNIGMTDTTAHVGDGASISGAKDIKLSASSTNELSNSADAGSKGKTAVTPSIAVSVANNDTEATLGTYSLTTNHNTGKVELTASHEGSVSSEASGATVNADGVSAKATMASRDVKFAVDHIDVIDTGKSTIFVGLDSGLKTGDKRTYDKGGNTNDPIDGLTSGNDYYVRVLDGGKIQLYEASDDAQHPDSAAKSGDETKLVHLTGTGSGTGHKLKWAFDAGNPLSLPGSDVSFDPSTQLRVIDLAEGSQLDTGDAVHYDNGGGSTMGGLNTTDTFYVIQLDDKHSQLAGSRQHALDGTAAKLNDDGNSNQKLVDSTDTFRAQARSGAGGGKIGVAGSVAINIAQVHTRGMIGYGGSGAASVTLVGGDVDLEAQSRTDNFVDASPTSSAHGAGGSSVGVGASFGLNVVLEDTTAGIADGQSVTGSAGQFTIKADNQNTAVTVAENGASGGGTQVGAAVAIAVVDISTTAKAGADQGGSVTTLTLSGALEVEAIHSDTVYTTTKGEAAGDGTAVGASVSLNIVTDDTIATVARSFTGGTLVTVASTSRMDTRAEARGSASGASSTKDGTNDTSDSNKSRDSQQETNHQADFATQKSGTSGKPSGSAQSDGISQGDSNSSSQSGNSSQGGTSVAASVAVNYMNVHNTARITGAGVSVTGTDHAKITADSDADASAQGLSTATNTKADTGVAAAVGVNIALVHNTAKVDDNVTLQAKDVAIKAEMMSGEKNTFVARALSGGVAKNTAVGGSVALNYIDVETTASIGANAHVSSTSGDIDVAAESRNEIQNVSGGAALSTSNGTGVGVAVSINILNKLDTEANVGHDAVVTATGGSVHITSNASLEPKTETLPIIGDVKITSFAAGVAASSGGAAIGGSSSIDVYFVDTHAFVEHDAHITADQGVTVSAQDAITVFSAAGGIGASSGSAGVGIGLDVGVIVRHTTAHVDEGAQVTANNGDITVHAQSDDDITSIAATFGLSSSSAGVAASVGVMVLITETRMEIGRASCRERV